MIIDYCAHYIGIWYFLKVLLVTSSSRPEQWIVPGGGIEPEEEPSATAVREVVEEAGVMGRLHKRLGTFEDKVSICDYDTNLGLAHDYLTGKITSNLSFN